MNALFSGIVRPKYAFFLLFTFVVFHVAAQQSSTINDQGFLWLNYKNGPGAFSLKIPGDYTPSTKEIPNSTYPNFPATKLHLFSVADTLSMKAYVFRYNDFPDGMHLADKQVAFEAVLKDLESKGKVVKQPSVIFKEDIEGRALDVVINEFYIQIQVYLRGNRQYLLLKQNLNGAVAPSDDQFFESFHFEPYQEADKELFALGSIELQMPQRPLLIPDSEGEKSFILNSKVYYGTNRNSGGFYGIEHGKISRYYKNGELDSLYLKALKRIAGKEDSIYKIADVNSAGVSGKELFLIQRKSGNHKRMRMWITGDDFYYQSLDASKDELSGSQAELFFNGVKQKNTPAFDMKASKLKLLLKDLKSLDTAIRNEAYAAFNYYAFSKDEMPLMYEAIKDTYSDDALPNGARILLMNEVSALSDEQTVPAFKAIFENDKNADEVRANALVKVVSLDPKSYDWYFNALKKSRPLKVEDQYRLFGGLRDSLDFTASHFEEVIPMFDLDEYRPALLNVAANMVFAKDKDSYKTLVKVNAVKMMAHAMGDLDNFIKQDAQGQQLSAASIYNYMNVLPATDQVKLSDEFTAKVLDIDSIMYLRNAAIVSRIKSSLPVDQKLLTAQLDSLNMRYDILHALNEMGKLESAPLKYRTPQEFARLLLYSYLEDNYDDFPASIDFLGTVKEGTHTFYAFSIAYMEDGVKKAYIGIGGGTEEKPAKLDFANGIGYTDFELVEKDWTAQAKKLMKVVKEMEQRN